MEGFRYRERSSLLGKLTGSIEEAICDISEIAQIVDSSSDLVKLFLSGLDILSHSKDVIKKNILTDPRIVSTVEQMQTGLSETGLNYIRTVEWTRNLVLLCRIGPAVKVLSCDTVSAMPIPLIDFSGVSLPGTGVILKIDPPLRINFPIIVHLKIQNGTVSLVGGRGCIPDVKGTYGLVPIAFPEPALQPLSKNEILLTEKQIAQNPWGEAVASAMSLIATHFDSQKLVINFSQLIVPIRNEKPNVLSSVSFDSHPGAIFSSWCEDYRMLAETLVHESDHQRHYLLTNYYQFWEPFDTEDKTMSYSPWRVDPRPLDGVFRGASAFDSVSSFWAAIATNTCKNDAWTAQRAVLTNYQAAEAIYILEQFGGFTLHGSMLLKELKESVVKTRDLLLSVDNFFKHLLHAENEQAEHAKLCRSASSKINNFIEVRRFCKSTYLSFI